MGGQRLAPADLPPGNTRYPLYRRLGGPQAWFGRMYSSTSHIRIYSYSYIPWWSIKGELSFETFFSAEISIYGGADKSLARPTSRCILPDGENISFDASFVLYINSINIPPIMIINRIYENQNLLSLWLVSFLVWLRTYRHPCIKVVMREVISRVYTR